MALVTVTLVDKDGIQEVKESKQRKTEEAELLFKHVQAMLILVQSVLDDMSTVALGEGQSSVRVALVDEEGIQEVEESKRRKTEEAKMLFECLQAVLFSIEAVIDRVTVLAKARAERLEGNQLS